MDWTKISCHLPEDYDEERHEILRHEVKYLEDRSSELSKEVEFLQNELDAVLAQLRAKREELSNCVVEQSQKRQLLKDYDYMVNVATLKAKYNWQIGNIIRRYDVDTANRFQVVGLTYGKIVGINNNGTNYLWRRIKDNGDLLKKVEEFEAVKFEKVTDSLEEFMEKFGNKGIK